MKKSELKQIIKEEIKNILNEVNRDAYMENMHEILNLLRSAISLWGFMKSDPSVQKDEQIAALRNYNKGKELFKKMQI